MSAVQANGAANEAAMNQWAELLVERAHVEGVEPERAPYLAHRGHTEITAGSTRPVVGHHFALRRFVISA